MVNSIFDNAMEKARAKISADIVERLNENIIADAFERKSILDGALCERLIRERKEAADTIDALRAQTTGVFDLILENARLTKERDNALHRAAEYRDECNSLTNQNRALRAARAAMGETE